MQFSIADILTRPFTKRGKDVRPLPSLLKSEELRRRAEQIAQRYVITAAGKRPTVKVWLLSSASAKIKICHGTTKTRGNREDYEDWLEVSGRVWFWRGGYRICFYKSYTEERGYRYFRSWFSGTI